MSDDSVMTDLLRAQAYYDSVRTNAELEHRAAKASGDYQAEMDAAGRWAHADTLANTFEARAQQRAQQIDDYQRQQQHQRSTAGLNQTGLEFADVCGMSPEEYSAGYQRALREGRIGRDR